MQWIASVALRVMLTGGVIMLAAVFGYMAADADSTPMRISKIVWWIGLIVATVGGIVLVLTVGVV